MSTTATTATTPTATTGDADETVTAHRFAPGSELLTVSWPDGRSAATLVHEVDQDVTAADLRALADAWEAYPAWLRARASEIEQAS